MNIFRILADLAHVASIFILLAKMRSSSSAAGISFKSQFLYLTVYLTRYLDLLWTDPTKSLWNTLFKIIFICAQFYIIYLMLNDYKPTHDPNQDTFKVEYLVGGAAVMGILFPYKYSIAEILWAFSIWLESVAILPQLFMLQRTGEAETITTHYLFALGLYRALYIPNWMAVFHGEWLVRCHCSGRRAGADSAVFGFLLDILYQGFARQEVQPAGLGSEQRHGGEVHSHQGAPPLWVRFKHLLSCIASELSGIWSLEGCDCHGSARVDRKDWLRYQEYVLHCTTRLKLYHYTA